MGQWRCPIAPKAAKNALSGMGGMVRTANRPRLGFEAIDASVAHEPSTDQQLHKSSAGTKQSGSGGHAVTTICQRLRSRFRATELALLGHTFGSLGNRAVDPRDLFADAEFGFAGCHRGLPIK